MRKDAPSPLEDKTDIHDPLRRTSGMWWMDADITVTAREDVTIKQAKHSFFALRVVPRTYRLFTAGFWRIRRAVSARKGHTESRRAGADITARRREMSSRVWRSWTIPKIRGRLVRGSPATTDISRLRRSRFIKQPWTLPRGKSIRMRYRIALHAGTPQQAGLDALYKKWIS